MKDVKARRVAELASTA